MTKARLYNILIITLPLSIILFGIITKWQYVHIEDGADDFLYGFPLVFICKGWHTSLSLQIFVTELVFDFLVYFIFCLITITVIDRFIKPIIARKYFKFGLYGFAILIFLFYGFVFSDPNNVFKMKRNFEYKKIKYGYKFVWQENKR